MASSILAHSDEHLYRINLKNLESAYHKINRSISSLVLLSDWVSENSSCDLSHSKKGMIDDILCSAIDLLKQTISILPEL